MERRKRIRNTRRHGLTENRSLLAQQQPTGPAAVAARSHHPLIPDTASLVKVCGLYLGVVLLLLSLLQTHVVQHSLSEPFRVGLAWVVSKALNLLGIAAVSRGATLTGGGLSAVILNECTGIEAMVLLVPAVLVFPASWRAKGRGILLSLGVMAVLNFVRVVSLCCAGIYSHTLLEVGHLYVWPAAVIAGGLVTLLFWVDHIAVPVQQ